MNTTFIVKELTNGWVVTYDEHPLPFDLDLYVPTFEIAIDVVQRLKRGDSVKEIIAYAEKGGV